MAFGNVDFTKTNAALQRLSQIMGYNWMDKERTRRDMESFMEQLGQREEYAKRGEQREMGMYKEKSAINLQDDFNKMLLDVQAKYPAADALARETRLNYQRYQQTEDPNYLNQAKSSAAQLIKIGSPLIDAWANVWEGKIGPDQVAAFFSGLGSEGVTKAIDQASTIKRAGVTAGLETDRLKLEEKKYGLERQKQEAKQKGGGETSDYYKAIHDKVQGVQSYLRGLNSAYKTGGVGLEELESDSTLQNLVGGSITPQKLAKLLARISSLDTKAMRGQLAPEEETEIDNAYDIFNARVEPPTMVPGQMPSKTPVIDKTALFNQVVGILMGKGMTREQATALAMTAPEFK